MLKEFKEFAAKGNMIDMAIGIVIGAAFGTVVSSLVADLLMPVISAVFGAPDFSNLFLLMKAPADASVDLTSIAAVREAGGVALGYGLFLNALISFLIIALALFVVVKGMNKMKRAEEEVPAEDPAPSSEEVLLAEIRDLLKAQAS